MKQNSTNKSPPTYQQLIRTNRMLQRQLKQSHMLITSLRTENQLLKQKLMTYENEQQHLESTLPVQGHRSDQEVFTDSSAEQEESFEQDHGVYEQEDIHIKRIYSQKQEQQVHRQMSEPVILTPLTVTKSVEKKQSHPRVIFNYQSEGTQVPKVLLKQQPKKQNYKQSPDNFIDSTQNNSINNNNKWSNFNVEYSAIKSQQPILIMKNSNSIFQRVRNSNKIYDYFFVTGFSFTKNAKTVQYCYPSQSEQFSAILSLIYTENSLRPFENISSGKSPRSSGQRPGKLSIKDSFVMILYKEKNFQRQYLFACQVDDVLEASDKSLYTFNRLFCFITSCTFFSALLKIIQQFINKINNLKQDYRVCSPLNQYNSNQILKSLFEEHLKILSQKNVKQNQYVNFGLGNQINIFIDVPSASQSYRTLLQYRPWGILFSPIYLPSETQQIRQKQLLGYLLIYMLTETKLLLYSSTKSKISEAILHTLQLMKPLEYVNPIIMATIRDEHQQYFNAPMSVVLGLWADHRVSKRKQKIEIFMNKKTSTYGLTAIVEENRGSDLDGVGFNLDTGAVFGSGLSAEKNKIAGNINYLIQNYCKSSKEKYKLLQNLITGKSGYQNLQLKQLSERLISQIQKTQLYSFYLQKNNSIIHL